MSRAVAVTTALPMLYGDDDVRTRIEQLSGLFSALAAYGIWYESADDLIEQVRGDASESVSAR